MYKIAKIEVVCEPLNKGIGLTPYGAANNKRRADKCRETVSKIEALLGVTMRLDACIVSEEDGKKVAEMQLPNVVVSFQYDETWKEVGYSGFHTTKHYKLIEKGVYPPKTFIENSEEYKLWFE